jgi:hypothetical protein
MLPGGWLRWPPTAAARLTLPSLLGTITGRGALQHVAHQDSRPAEPPIFLYALICEYYPPAPARRLAGSIGANGYERNDHT